MGKENPMETQSSDSVLPGLLAQL